MRKVQRGSDRQKNLKRRTTIFGVGDLISYSKEYIRTEKRRYKRLIKREEKICKSCPDKDAVGCANCMHQQRIEDMNEELDEFLERVDA